MRSVVEVRYFAAVADATGCAKETLDLPAAATISDLKVALIAKYGPSMERIVAVSAYLIAEELTRVESHPLGASVDVLPPFAGG